MPNPKYKTPRSKTRRRRSHLALTPPALVECARCHEKKLAHHVCKECGFYNGREVIAMQPKDK